MDSTNISMATEEESSEASAMTVLGKRTHDVIESSTAGPFSQECGDPRAKITKIGSHQSIDRRVVSVFKSNMNMSVNMNMNTNMCINNMNVKLPVQNVCTLSATIPTAKSVTLPMPLVGMTNPSLSAMQVPQPILTAGSTNTQSDCDENLPRELKPAPYFYYRDNSHKPDDDPLTPLTPLARVPNFTAKMQAILSRPDLSDVVTWMPHGRSWKVLKPREFEIRVIPTYFEHSKFSSFIRQANGWGFRRITRGKDRNSYYHELFLRGLPHLCKGMRRPGVSKKAEAEYEPDFYSISAEHPLPEKASSDYNILLPATLAGGPKARMPVGVESAYMPTNISSSINSTNGHHVLNYMNHLATTTSQQNVVQTAPNAMMPQICYPKIQNYEPIPGTNPTASGNGGKQVPTSSLNTPDNSIAASIHTQAPFSSQQHKLSQAPQQTQHHQQPMISNYQANALQQAMVAAAAAAMGNDPSSQFAAGFAAATAGFQLAFNRALADGNAAMAQGQCPNTNSTAPVSSGSYSNYQNSSDQSEGDSKAPAMDHSAYSNMK